MNYHLRVTEEPPMPPNDADLAFTIDFKKGEGNPRRVFDAASDLIEAFEVLDSALAMSIDKTIEPLLVLEDVEAGSLKVWLKNAVLGSKLRRTSTYAASRYEGAVARLCFIATITFACGPHRESYAGVWPELLASPSLRLFRTISSNSRATTGPTTSLASTWRRP